MEREEGEISERELEKEEGEISAGDEQLCRPRSQSPPPRSPSPRLLPRKRGRRKRKEPPAAVFDRSSAGTGMAWGTLQGHPDTSWQPLGGAASPFGYGTCRPYLLGASVCVWVGRGVADLIWATPWQDLNRRHHRRCRRRRR